MNLIGDPDHGGAIQQLDLPIGWSDRPIEIWKDIVGRIFGGVDKRSPSQTARRGGKMERLGLGCTVEHDEDVATEFLWIAGKRRFA